MIFPLASFDRFRPFSFLSVEICDFSDLSAALPPDDLVALLNTIFSVFDEIIRAASAYKVRGR